MEISEGSVENQLNTPKRSREDDSISPASTQRDKDQKMSTLIESDVLALRQLFTDFGVMKSEFAVIRSMKDDITEIKESQQKYLKKVEDIERKIESLEHEVDALKERGIGDDAEQELDELRKKNHAVEQAMINERLTIRNLPIEIREKREDVQTTVERIFNILQLDINSHDYEAYATPTPNRKLAKIELKFSSAMLKARVLRKFRESKRAITDDSPFIVERLIQLPSDHELNGKLISISNKLTPHNAQLIKSARKLSPSHFDFAYDSPEGVIFVKVGERSHRIMDESDIMMLKEDIEKSRAAAGTRKNQGGGSKITPAVTRNARKKSSQRGGRT